MLSAHGALKGRLMTIASAIAILTPDVYWKFDEVAGPTAFDSSGNGHPGVYQPNTVFQLPGPEVGTQGIGSSFPDAGAQISGLNPIAEIHPTSALGWLASALVGGVPDNRYLHIGAPASNGIGLIIANTGEVQVLFGGLLVIGSGLFVVKNAWHLCGFVFDGVTTTSVYVDVQAPALILGHTPAPSLPANPLVAETPGAFYMGHCAFWNRALSTIEVQSVFTGAGPLNGGPFASGGSVTTIDIASLEAKLDRILADVERTYTTP